MKVLHIDSGILGEGSVSRMMSAQVMEKLKEAVPNATVIYRDLDKQPIPHLTSEYFAASQAATAEHEPELKADLALGGVLLDEFIEADIVVIGASLYNLSVSSALKAWIDRIIILNKTFRYSAEGELQGLMGDKRVILCVSRGGFYAEGQPGAAMEHCESLMRAVLGFIGITKLEVITADGTMVGPEHRSQALASFTEQVSSLKF